MPLRLPLLQAVLASLGFHGVDFIAASWRVQVSRWRCGWYIYGRGQPRSGREERVHRVGPKQPDARWCDGTSQRTVMQGVHKLKAKQLGALEPSARERTSASIAERPGGPHTRPPRHPPGSESISDTLGRCVTTRRAAAPPSASPNPAATRRWRKTFRESSRQRGIAIDPNHFHRSALRHCPEPALKTNFRGDQSRPRPLPRLAETVPC